MALTKIRDAALPADSVLQIVSAELAKDGTVNTTSTSYVDTGLSATITPSITGNKIKITVVANIRGKATSGQDLDWYQRLLVGATELDEVRMKGDNMGKLGDTIYVPISLVQSYIYTTTSTDAITFKTQVKAAASGEVRYRENDTFIILEEIAQ